MYERKLVRLQSVLVAPKPFKGSIPCRVHVKRKGNTKFPKPSSSQLAK